MEEKFYTQQRFYYSVFFDDYYEQLVEKYEGTLDLDIEHWFELPAPVSFKKEDQIRIQILDEGGRRSILHQFEIERVVYLLLPATPEEEQEQIYSNHYTLYHELHVKTIDKEQLSQAIEEAIKSKNENN